MYIFVECVRLVECVFCKCIVCLACLSMSVCAAILFFSAILEYFMEMDVDKANNALIGWHRWWWWWWQTPVAKDSQQTCTLTMIITESRGNEFRHIWSVGCGGSMH